MIIIGAVIAALILDTLFNKTIVGIVLRIGACLFALLAIVLFIIVKAV